MIFQFVYLPCRAGKSSFSIVVCLSRRVETHPPPGQETSHLATSPPYNSAVKLSGPEPLRSPPPLPQPTPRAMNNRELPPTPAERAARRESLPATERLDRLTRGEGSEQGSSPDGRPVDPNRRRSAAGEQGREARHMMARSRSVGPQGYHPAEAGGQGAGGRGGPSRQGESEHELRDGRDHSYGESNRFNASGSSNRQLPPSHAPRPYQRPASVMGRPSPSPQNSPHLRQDTNNSSSTPQRQSGAGEREAQCVRAEPMVGAANGLVQRREGHQGFVERPKSVPPHLFNKPIASSGGQGGNVNMKSSTSPVPPPRHSREVMSHSSQDGQSHDRDAVPRVSLDGSLSGRSALFSAAPGAVGTPGRAGPPSSASLPNRYIGPGGSQTQGYSPGGPSPGSVANHGPAAAGRPPIQRHPSPSSFHGAGSFQGAVRPDQGSGCFQGAPRQDSTGAQPGPAYGRSITPGPKYGSEQYGRDAPDASNPYSTPHRPQSSMGRAYHHGNQPSPLSAQQRLNPGANPPGPQHPYHGPLQDGGRLDHNHRPLMDQHSHTSNQPPTPMARIPPQTKVASPPAGRGDPSANQRTAVGDEQPHDRPKQNSMWYEYGCV